MNERTGAALGGLQREAIRNGDLKAAPPRCSKDGCFMDSEVWVEIRHPDDSKDDYKIPRCDDHTDDVPHTRTGVTEPVE